MDRFKELIAEIEDLPSPAIECAKLQIQQQIEDEYEAFNKLDINEIVHQIDKEYDSWQ